MKLRRKFEKITESILFASSTVTTLTVLLIIIFFIQRRHKSFQRQVSRKKDIHSL